jgi:hypothetical protein
MNIAMVHTADIITVSLSYCGTSAPTM